MNNPASFRAERNKRLARDIAQLGMLTERVKAILSFGSARYQEGYEDAIADEAAIKTKEEPPEQPPITSEG